MCRVRLGLLSFALTLIAPVHAAPPSLFSLFAHEERGEGAGGLFRHETVEQAWSASQSSRRPMLLYVTTDSCYYCKKMITDTLKNPEVNSALASYTEPTLVNAAKSPELAKRLGVRAYPTTLIISPDNRLLHRVVGYAVPAEFSAGAWPVLQQSQGERRLAQRDAASVARVAPISPNLSQPGMIVP